MNMEKKETKFLQKIQDILDGSLIPPDIKTHVQTEMEKAWDKVRANILLQKAGFEPLMNKGYTLDEAQTFLNLEKTNELKPDE